MIPPAVDRSKQLRMPVFDRADQPRTRVDALGDYMLLTANVRGELAELRIDTRESLRILKREWRNLKGWETFRKGKTDESIEQAKRELRPDLADAIADAEHLIWDCSSEMERLDRDATICSRAYTFLSGS